MTTIKITDERAILVKDNTVALAQWQKNIDKDKNEKWSWAEYRWPSNMERAIELLAQEFVSDMQLTVSMKEFKLYFEGAMNQIKAKINGEGS